MAVESGRDSGRSMNIQQAKQIKLESLLEGLGHQPDRKTGDELWYHSPFRDEQTASFKLHSKKNIWYDFGLGKGGTVIDFGQAYFRSNDISVILSKLDELDKNSSSSHPQPSEPKQAKRSTKSSPLRITDLGPIKHPALIDYLKSRSIEPALAERVGFQEVHYSRGGKNYFALAMMNDTGLQSGVGFEVRNKHFKGTFGPKDIRTIPGNSGSVHIYEGAFDYLSHLSLAADRQIDATVIILNSAAMRDKALAKIRSLHPSEVNLYLDHDASGRELAMSFRELLPKTRVNDKSGLYAGWKDFNEFHASRGPLFRLTKSLQIDTTNHQPAMEGPSR